jgi:hypothetical protein
MKWQIKVLVASAAFLALIASCGIATALWIRNELNDALNEGRLSVQEAREFNDFTLVWLGETYAGLDLNEIRSYGSEPSEFENIELDPAVTITYGEKTCPEGGSHCWTPVWIHIQPYCLDPPEQVLPWIQHLASTEESYSDYAISEVELRGVQAYRFGDSRIYLWTASSAVIVDANTPGVDVTQLAEGLIPMSEDSGAGRRPLQPPVSTEC